MQPEQQAEPFSNMRKFAAVLTVFTVIVWVWVLTLDEPTEDPQAVPTTPATSTTTPIEPEPEPEPEPKPEPEPEPEIDDDWAQAAAQVACRDFVDARLVSPDSADHSWDARVQRSGRTWRVHSTLTADNRYGAPLPLKYACTVSYTGNNEFPDAWDFRLVSLTGLR